MRKRWLSPSQQSGPQKSRRAIGMPSWALALMASAFIISTLDDKDTGRKGRAGKLPRASFHCRDHLIASLSWSPDGRTLAMGGLGETVWIWDPKSGRVGSIDTGKDEPAPASREFPRRIVAYSPDGSTLAIGSSDGSVSVREVERGGLVARLAGRDAPERLAWSPDGRTLAILSRDREIRLWDVAGDRVRILDGSRLPHACLAYSADGRTIAVGGIDGCLRSWDADSGRRIAAFRVYNLAVRSLVFADGRGRVVTTGTDDLPRMWDLVTGTELPPAKKARVRCPNSSISPDSKRIAAVSWDGIASISGIDDGEMQSLLTGHMGGVLDMAWSPDSREFVMATHDAAVQIWDASGRP